MPLYEYQCTACGKLTEKRQKFSDPEITECPHCGGRLERTITAPAVQFKGGGWYADGYGSKKPVSNASSDSGDSAKSGRGSTSEIGGKTDAANKSDGGSKTESSGSSSTPAPSSAPASTPSSSSTPAK